MSDDRERLIEERRRFQLVEAEMRSLTQKREQDRLALGRIRNSMSEALILAQSFAKLENWFLKSDGFSYDPVKWEIRKKQVSALVHVFQAALRDFDAILNGEVLQQGYFCEKCRADLHAEPPVEEEPVVEEVEVIETVEEIEEEKPKKKGKKK